MVAVTPGGAWVWAPGCTKAPGLLGREDQGTESGWFSVLISLRVMSDCEGQDSERLARSGVAVQLPRTRATVQLVTITM